ncbi:hypothetical protein [Bradyrhizobium sp. Leo170]|uniref:hypothetical protein n=1 Tax=Bradyrhizobium sp. Leo170 TaxID=1571199 RepID=UPI00102E5537|nr:hypothetical protein [Bradyrhizobium sp. Leo170]TAI60320.1 hypothetical protein CWO89_41310 [Bradyrhizobium sp. Leo170]
MINLAVASITVPALPAATFLDETSRQEWAPERRRYEAAVTAFAREASPAALRARVSTLRRCGIAKSMAEARQDAADNLRDELRAIGGYDAEEIEWHCARRGRRQRVLYVAARKIIAN